MALITRHQILAAVIGGGGAGALLAALLALIAEHRVATMMEVFTGGWIGFALTCAVFLILNSTSHRQSR